MAAATSVEVGPGQVLRVLQKVLTWTFHFRLGYGLKFSGHDALFLKEDLDLLMFQLGDANTLPSFGCSDEHGEDELQTALLGEENEAAFWCVDALRQRNAQSGWLSVLAIPKT